MRHDMRARALREIQQACVIARGMHRRVLLVDRAAEIQIGVDLGMLLRARDDVRRHFEPLALVLAPRARAP